MRLFFHALGLGCVFTSDALSNLLKDFPIKLALEFVVEDSRFLFAMS